MHSIILLAAGFFFAFTISAKESANTPDSCVTKQPAGVKMLEKNNLIELQLKMSELLKERSGLPTLARKLKNGEPVQIGFLGGSITMGEGYRVLVTKSLQTKYPRSRISGINGGIGGTGSPLGAFRVYKDILKHKPDLVFVEFAVNDCEHTSPEQSMAAMEGIVRQIKRFNSETDICFIYTVNRMIKEALEAGKLYWTVNGMEKIADYYSIPSINLGPEVLAREKCGRLVFQLPDDPETIKTARQAGKLVFSHDSVHPTLDDGHGLYSKVIMTALDKLLAMPLTETPVMPTAALSAHPWINTKMLTPADAKLSKHWKKINPAEYPDLVYFKFPELWKTNDPGAEMHFRFKGIGFGLVGLFGLNSGQFRVWIDGREYRKVPLFDKYGNYYRIHYTIIADSLPDEEHSVVLQLDSQPPDRSILLPSRPIDNPAKLKGVVAYLKNLLILGKLL